MPRYTGQCVNCGESRSPQGNVFTVMPSWAYEGRHTAPDSDTCKVCNNCGWAVAFKPRISAKAAAREALIQSLLNA